MSAKQHAWFDFVDQEKYDRNEPKWMKALRSGRYRQGREALHTEHEFCCLGVGCKAARIKEHSVLGSIHFSYGEHSEDMLAPVELAEWLGFEVPDRDPKANPWSAVVVCLGNESPIRRSSPPHSLAKYAELNHLNDEGMTFDEIADLIEEHGVRARWQ